MNTTELLFSYGTLQNVEVQLETFRRKLVGYDDVLLGYQLEMVEIKDEAVVALSGESHHPIAIEACDTTNEIPGMVFEISADELNHSDQYEVNDYKRIFGNLKSGKKAWVYVNADKNICE